MGCLRIVICILFPPLGVIDKGCGTILLVCFLTLLGYVPGIVAALLICRQDAKTEELKRSLDR